jgi:membrane-associated protein
MEVALQVIDFVLHINKHIEELTASYGSLVYLALFVIVFCETGLVFTPFLPGDSLLFAAGAVAAAGSLDPWFVGLTVFVAAVLGDATNYTIGKHGGTWLSQRFPKVVKASHIEKTHSFYEKYGAKALVIARFVPIVRTFAPFVAGVGRMTFSTFSKFNVLGAALWVILLVPAGYFFANVPFVKERFSLVILAIIGLSILPAVIEVWRARRVPEAS